jgi:hypothetical protein
MAAEDELFIPEVPEAKPEDPEDVSWALSTAEAMWARGDHAEGIKWVRRAAEAASEAEDDMRALQLAKAAADLAGLLARKSIADESRPNVDAPKSSQPSPNTERSVAPPSKAPPAPKAKSAPPVPLPSKSVAPPSPSVPPKVAVPKPPNAPAAPRALASGNKAQGPAAGKGILSNRPGAPEKKGKRRSRENLEAEAAAAGLIPQPKPSDTAEIPALDSADVTAAVEVPVVDKRVRRSSRPDREATVVARVKDLVDGKTVAEWDNQPTENLTGPDFDRQTTVGQMPAAAPPQPSASRGSMRPPQTSIHDPEIQTSQAVRVVVWRDGSGVHLAPAGTRVSALTIDAVLVALDPTADLTAWLSPKKT